MVYSLSPGIGWNIRVLLFEVDNRNNKLLTEWARTPQQFYCLARANTGVNFDSPKQQRYNLISRIPNNQKSTVEELYYIPSTFCLSKIESFRLGD